MQTLAGPRYARRDGAPHLVRWGRQSGSVYLADQKLPIVVPRVRNRHAGLEVPLQSYARLQQPRAADEGLLRRIMYGLSCRDYRAAAEAVPEAFGLSRSSIGPASIGGPGIAVIAGPCSVESREQILTTAKAVNAAGATILRGGALKPRTSPYSFQGLEEEGLQLLAEARDRTGLPVVTEAMDASQVELVCRYADMIQIGARNMQNYLLLREAGRTTLPVMLKRGISATIEEWLLAAEYIVNEGNSEMTPRGGG